MRQPHDADTVATVGFSLLEVIVAMAVLTVALLGIARVLGDATLYAVGARRSWRALERASALAATFEADAAIAVDAGCGVIVTEVETATLRWRLIEARCPADGLASPGLGDRVRLLTTR